VFHGLVKVMNVIAEWWCTFQCTHVLHTMPVEKNICLSVKWCQKCAQKEQPKMTKYCFLCTCTRTNLCTCFNYWRLCKKWQKTYLQKSAICTYFDIPPNLVKMPRLNDSHFKTVQLCADIFQVFLNVILAEERTWDLSCCLLYLLPCHCWATADPTPI
jgi:hypothetical protein